MDNQKDKQASSNQPEVLARQVAQWTKERDRLQDLIDTVMPGAEPLASQSQVAQPSDSGLCEAALNLRALAKSGRELRNTGEYYKLCLHDVVELERVAQLLDNADAYLAGQSQATRAAPEGWAEKADELVRDLYNFEKGRHFAVRLEKLIAAAPAAQEVTQQAAPEAEHIDLPMIIRLAQDAGFNTEHCTGELLSFATALLAAAPATTQQAAKAETAEQAKTELTVWYGPMPESNGKSNFTATLMRKGADLFDTDQYTFCRSEFPDRVRYEADFMSYLIGERTERPEMWDKGYDFDKHSGYAAPTTSTVSAPLQVKHGDDCLGGGYGGPCTCGAEYVQAPAESAQAAAANDLRKFERATTDADQGTLSLAATFSTARQFGREFSESGLLSFVDALGAQAAPEEARNGALSDAEEACKAERVEHIGPDAAYNLAIDHCRDAIHALRTTSGKGEAA